MHASTLSAEVSKKTASAFSGVSDALNQMIFGWIPIHNAHFWTAAGAIIAGALTAFLVWYWYNFLR